MAIDSFRKLKINVSVISSYNLNSASRRSTMNLNRPRGVVDAGVILQARLDNSQHVVKESLLAFSFLRLQ